MFEVVAGINHDGELVGDYGGETQCKLRTTDPAGKGYDLIAGHGQLTQRLKGTSEASATLAALKDQCTRRRRAPFTCLGCIEIGA